ncbi:MAG: pseudouridine synthase [Pirellulales bacterium]
MSTRRSKPRPISPSRRRLRAKRGNSPIAEDAASRPRLQKVLAAAGLGSRRQCEELITEGRVDVDRRVVTELGTRVDPVQQEIRVDGEPLPRPKRQYLMLNKPMGVVSTARDPAGRPRVTDLVPGHQRLFPVGRLDMSSEGLILVTNDGELANLLTHPRYEVEKTYLAQVAGAPGREALAKLERGVHLAEGYAHAKRVRIKSQHKQSSTLEIVLDEGRNREVRRLLARIGHKVLRLKRIAIGSLRLGNLAPGEYRPLGVDEVRELKEAALAALKREKPGPRGPKIVAPAERPKVPQPRPAMPEMEESVSEDLEDFHPPRRPGTIIGDEETPPPAERGSSPTVRPLIDVRRGIFPGRQTDDFDEDELVEQPAERPVSVRQQKPKRQERPDRPPGKGRSQSKSRPQGTDRSQRKGRSSGTGRPPSKGRSGQSRAQGNVRSQSTGPSLGKGPSSRKASKRPDRRKGRRR